MARQSLMELGQPIPLRAEEMTDDDKARAALLPVTYDNLAYLPCTPELNDVIFAELERQLAVRPISCIVDLPVTTDPLHVAISLLICQFLPGVFLYDTELWRSLCFLAVVHVLRHGITGSDGYSIVCGGVAICEMRDAWERRLPSEYGKAGVRVCERFNWLPHKGRAYIVDALFCHHWIEDPKESYQRCEHGRKAAMQLGDLLFGMWGILCSLSLAQHFKPLPELESDIRDGQAMNRGALTEAILANYLNLLKFATAALTTTQPASVDPAVITADEEAAIARAVIVSPVSAQFFFVSRARSQLVLGRPDLALVTLERCQLHHITYMYDRLVYTVVQSLAALALIRQHTGDAGAAAMVSSPDSGRVFDVAQCWARVEANQAMMAVWRKGSPANFRGVDELIKAEIAFTQLLQCWKDKDKDKNTSQPQQQQPGMQLDELLAPKDDDDPECESVGTSRWCTSPTSTSLRSPTSLTPARRPTTAAV